VPQLYLAHNLTVAMMASWSTSIGRFAVITLEEDRRIPPEQRWAAAGSRLNEATAKISPAHLTSVGRVLFAISFANKQIGGGHKGLSH
jgi:hypothetical protein